MVDRPVRLLSQLSPSRFHGDLPDGAQPRSTDDSPLARRIFLMAKTMQRFLLIGLFILILILPSFSRLRTLEIIVFSYQRVIDK